jgi:hypothetical protein
MAFCGPPAPQKPLCLRKAGLPTRVSGGPLHYQIRAGTYGEIYDEIPWKVAFGIAESKGRDPTDRSSVVRSYNPTDVLVNNWVENRRDREFIKFRRPPPLSQNGWFYKSTYQEAYNKRRCEKERLFLQSIKAFPIGIYPGHQREVNVDMLCCCVPKPELCQLTEAKEQCEKESKQQKRVLKENPPPAEEPNYEICQS